MAPSDIGSSNYSEVAAFNNSQRRANPNRPLVLVVAPDAEPQKAGRFIGRLSSTGEIIVRSSRQPLVDGARELLARGFDPATTLTMRVEGKACDSFRPAPIREWAKWSYAEGEKTPLQRQRWKPREMPVAACPGDQNLGVEPPAGVQVHPEANSLLRLDGPEASGHV